MEMWQLGTHQGTAGMHAMGFDLGILETFFNPNDFVFQ